MTEMSAVAPAISTPPPAHRTPSIEADSDRGVLRLAGRGFTWIGCLYVLAKGSVVFSSVLAGRLLGTAEYGRVNLVLAVSTFLSIALTMGFPLAISKFVAEEQDWADQRKIVSTAISSFAVWALAVSALLVLFRGWMSRVLGLPESVFLWAIAYSVLNSAHSVVASPFLGRTRFAQRGVIEALYGLGVPVAIGVAVYCRGKDYSAIVLSFCAAFAVASAMSLWLQRDDLHAGFHPQAFGRIWHYSVLGSLGLLSTALVVAPSRLILHRYFSVSEVGIFSAYFNSTAQVSLTALYLVASIVVPLASRHPGIFKLGHHRRSSVAIAATATWLAFSFAAALSLKAFGRQYPFHLGWIFLFAAAATAILLHGVCSAILSARDVKGLCLSLAGSLAAGFSHLALAALLIPWQGLLGAGESLFAAYGIGLAYFAMAWPEKAAD